MKRNYYAVSGTFYNAIIVHRFASIKDRDSWVDDTPMTGVGSHFEHDRCAVSRKKAYRQLAYNRWLTRRYRKYGAPYSQCYGTTRFED